MEIRFDSVEAALEDIKNGKMIIVTDDENRENEGDLVFAAELVTPEKINFMITHARGLVHVPRWCESILGFKSRQSRETGFPGMD